MLAWTSMHQSAPDVWATSQFQGSRLGHCARRSRLVAYARALAEQPGKMIPELFINKYDIDATYDLLDRRELTPDAIQMGHRRLVRDELRTPGRYLLIEDTTFPSFSHRKKAVPGLGPIGGSEQGQQGFLLHSVVAVRAPLPAEPDATGHRPPVTILGLIDQQYLIRSPRPEAKSKQAISRQRTQRDRESDRWLESSRRIGAAPAGSAVRWVRVADREADIYEYLAECILRNHGFLVRVNQDRVILDPSSGARLGLVFEHIAGVEPCGGMYLDLRSRDGQKARRAQLLASCGPVRVRAPERPGIAAGTNTPIDCWFIRIWEPSPPEGVEALEWVLYADQPTETLEAALVAAMDYATRFLIEEFHKGLKTGLKAEELQLETGHRLFAAIAVMSIVALRLLDLRELGRAVPEAAARVSGLSDLELEVLSLAVNRPLTTVASVLLAVGRLGGHMNRKSDGMPGWITLWRGMKTLRLLVRGAELERERNDKYVHT
jgi:Transposase DNA-binding/Transposase Tn5 dimerisation domain